MKRIAITTFVLALTISGMQLSAQANQKYIAESDEQIVSAEKFLNSSLETYVKVAIKDLDKHEKDQQNKDLKKEDYNKQKEKLEKVKSYKDITLNWRVSDIEKNQDSEEARLYFDIEKYKDTHPTDDIKNIVKFFNKQAGLKDKSSQVISMNFGNVAQASSVSYEKWTELTTAEKVLVAADPASALKTQQLANKAYNATKDKFGSNGLGDKSDGFRHGLWNALMTRDITRLWAYSYATAHEDKSSDYLNAKETDGYYGYEHKSMDLHNNEEGRDSVSWYEYSWNCSDTTLIDRISDKLTNNSSDIIWLHD